MHLALGTMHVGPRTDRATSFVMLDRLVEAGVSTLGQLDSALAAADLVLDDDDLADLDVRR
ncbi:hypothetical protein [Nocardioides sp.]|uniref:hypothetical protein n=1 Tax=Nocardioides sp. TaxID=35761 RepID=UPI00286CF98A|nr:hypothetical protein [Nocardioides sp.]